MNHHSVRTSFTQIYDSGQLQMKIKSKVCFAVLVSPPRYCHPMSQVTLVLIPDQQQIKTAARYNIQFYIFRGVYHFLDFVNAWEALITSSKSLRTSKLIDDKRYL